MNEQARSKWLIPSVKWGLTVVIAVASCYAGLGAFVLSLFLRGSAEMILAIAAIFLLPSLLPFIWSSKRKKYLIIWLCCIAAVLAAFGIAFGIQKYEESITIDVTPNINVNEYLPFDENSKIVKLDSKLLKLTGTKLPIIDGATAAFPVYSAFVNAVYPDTTRLWDGVFEYNNTVGGYELLAQKQTDIFIGAAPSKEQKAYAEQCGTTFEYTQIGSEAFVFFVHKDNPIDSLSAEQIRKIYSGEITNWSEVGGADEKIMAFQRNEGSGSQSMMLRFMGDVPLMEPDMQEVVGGMGGIISTAIATTQAMMTLAGAETIEGVAETFAKAPPYTKIALTATALAGILSMIATAKSSFAGSFADGGVVGGTSYTGDKLWARVNSGEMIIPRNAMNGGNVTFVIEGSQLKGVLDNYESINQL